MTAETTVAIVCTVNHTETAQKRKKLKYPATEFQTGVADKPMIGNAALRKIITTKATHPVKLSERAAASQTDDGYSLKTLVSLQWGLS